MKNQIAYILAGMMLAAILAGPAASAAEQIIAAASLPAPSNARSAKRNACKTQNSGSTTIYKAA